LIGWRILPLKEHDIVPVRAPTVGEGFPDGIYNVAACDVVHIDQVEREGTEGTLPSIVSSRPSKKVFNIFVAFFDVSEGGANHGARGYWAGIWQFMREKHS
jgi:hypothetical protein